MQGLYPIVRRKRRPLIEVAPVVKAPEQPVLQKPQETPKDEKPQLQNIPTAAKAAKA